MRKVLTIVLALVLTLCLVACISEKPSRIRTSDISEINLFLTERYELTLPESVKFIGGYFDNAFRDPSVLLAFTVSTSDFGEMFCDKWHVDDLSRQGDPTIIEELLPLEDFKPTACYDYSGESYTTLWYCSDSDGRYLCVFMGHHPGTSF